MTPTAGSHGTILPRRPDSAVAGACQPWPRTSRRLVETPPALADGQVLRRYKTAHSCAAEAELMRYLRDAGYPVPEVFAVDGKESASTSVGKPARFAAI